MKQQITTFLVGDLLVFALSAASLKQLSPNALPASRRATADPGVKAARAANRALVNGDAR